MMENGHNYTFAMPEMPWHKDNNGFFHLDDSRLDAVVSWHLPDGWWSRRYEYAWALDRAKAGDIVADMGCGYTFRPLKNALATICKTVYAVDSNPRLWELPMNEENLIPIEADFTEYIDEFGDGGLDTIFCISVLEDVGSKVVDALKEFRRLIKPNGKIVLTFDTVYDLDKPRGPWPGIDIEDFLLAVEDAELNFVGSIDMDTDNLVYNEEFNLCVFHAVLAKL